MSGTNLHPSRATKVCCAALFFFSTCIRSAIAGGDLFGGGGRRRPEIKAPVGAAQYYEDLFGFDERAVLASGQGFNTDETNAAVRSRFAVHVGVRPEQKDFVGTSMAPPQTISLAAYTPTLEAGCFRTPSVAQLEQEARAYVDAASRRKMGPKRGRRKSRFAAKRFDSSDKDSDIGRIAERHPLATIQGASQLNALEQMSEHIDPQGIVPYVSDLTQGPAVAITGFAGALWRNHFVAVEEDGTATMSQCGHYRRTQDLHQGLLGQTKTRQINYFKRVWREILAKTLGFPDWENEKHKQRVRAAEEKIGAVQNGYLLVGRARATLERAADLFDDAAVERLFVSEMRVGVQEHTDMALYRNCGLEVVFVVGNADSARAVQPLVEARMKKAVEDAKAGAHREYPEQGDMCVGFRPAGEDEEDGVSGGDGAEITLLGSESDTDGEGGPDDAEASRPNGSGLMWLLLAVCIPLVAGLSVGIVALVLCCCRAGDDNGNASAEVAAASEDINEAGFLISDEKVSTALG
eukprot:g16998.t1